MQKELLPKYKFCIEINGLTLPNSYVEKIQTGILRRKLGSWSLLYDVDAYGNELECELGQIYETKDEIISATNNLSKDFTSDGYYGELSEWQHKPGFVSDILDFSKIVCFGISGDGSPFCFDYCENAETPSVVWWDDVYWRQIAPNFDSFLRLFEVDEMRKKI